MKIFMAASKPEIKETQEIKGIHNISEFLAYFRTCLDDLISVLLSFVFLEN